VLTGQKSYPPSSSQALLVATLLCFAAIADAVSVSNTHDPDRRSHSLLPQPRKHLKSHLSKSASDRNLSPSFLQASNKTADHILVGPLDAKSSADSFIFIVRP